MSLKDEALNYHKNPKPGKTEIKLTKPCLTQDDLTLAYSPGVAEPCLEIHRNQQDVYKYTNKANLVAVLSNGTAVLGLGNIGPEAFKPVGEGKAVLFKKFANVDAFDIEINSKTSEEVINVAQALEPTFGGINLEDIKAPECFEIEERLKEKLNIPVFHDDQWGTAIITGAAMINCLLLTDRKWDDLTTVISGAGAAGIAMGRLLCHLGHKRENILLVDSRGVAYSGRKDGMNKYKEEFAAKTDKRTLADALDGADCFLGVSVKDTVTPEMIKKMNKNPIIFAMANPDPEIPYNLAKETRPDAIVGTGRSDFPNQVNNVLGFPFIFRGALDVAAKAINDEMMVAASEALAELARTSVTKEVKDAYGMADLAFGPDYVIPKPTDRRVLYHVAPAVARAAIETKVARKKIDIDTYGYMLQRKIEPSRRILKPIFKSAARKGRKIIFPEGEEPIILQAAEILLGDALAKPVLVGNTKKIQLAAEKSKVDISAMEILDPQKHPEKKEYAKKYLALRRRKGLTKKEADKRIKRPVIFSAMHLHLGNAHGMVVGQNLYYRHSLIPLFQILPTAKNVKHAIGAYIIIPNNENISPIVLGDATIGIKPTKAELAESGKLLSDLAESIGLDPVVAFLSHASFGSSPDEEAARVQAALRIFRDKWPEIPADGEMQADVALNTKIIKQTYPFSPLANESRVNVLVCPDLDSANISYKLLQSLGEAHLVGPILLGMKHAVHVLERHCGVGQVVELATLAAAQEYEQ